MSMRSKRMAGCTISILLVAVAANARPRTQREFLAHYGVPKTKLENCLTCHTTNAQELNPYGLALKGAGFDFVAIEAMDSDHDGAKNIDEIHALTFPGDATDHPGASLKADSLGADSIKAKVGSAGADTTVADSAKAKVIPKPRIPKRKASKKHP